MNCSEARENLTTNSQAHTVAPYETALADHLADCPDCRACQPPNEQPRPGRRRAAQWLVAAPLVLVVLVGVWLSGIGWRTERNLAAMVVTPVPNAATAPATSDMPVAARINPLRALPQLVAPASTATPAAVVAAAVPAAAPAPVLPTPLPERSVTILLLGHDQRPGEQTIPRTDAVMLVRVDPARQRIALLSLPRDLWVTIPGYGANRINAAYVWGEYYGGPGNGLPVARATVENLLGTPIDYVALIGFESFIGLIDTLGGVTVEVEKELYDEYFPTMNYGYTVIHFQPGPQVMDGVTALSYSRIRHPDNDFERIRRQQAVLMAIGDRLRERGDLSNALDADRISAELVNFVRTDMPRDEIVRLVWALRHYDLAAVERYSLSQDMVSFGVGSDRYALSPIPAALQTVRSQFIGQQQ